METRQGTTWRFSRALGLISGAVLLSAFLADPAGAGVVGITQGKVAAGRVTPGDSPGFPLTLSRAGSYQLQGNLLVADPVKTAIEITADNVTLDLNGFTISGPTVCSGDPDWTCAPTGAGKGITSVRENVTVINGTVTGMGSTGIQVGNLARVERVRAIGNGGYGISAGRGCILSGNTLSRNGVDGIVAYDGSIISGNAAYENPQVGIAAYGAIAVLGNTVRSNHDYGISISSTTGYGSNVLSGNGYGHVIGTGVQLGQNVCGEDNTCP